MNRLRKIVKYIVSLMITFGYWGGVILSPSIVMFYFLDGWDAAYDISLIIIGIVVFGAINHLLFRLFFWNDPVEPIGKKVGLLPSHSKPEVLFRPLHINLQRYLIVRGTGLKMMGIYGMPGIFLVGLIILIITISTPQFGLIIMSVSLIIFSFCWLVPAKIITLNRDTGLIDMPGAFFVRRKQLRFNDCEAYYDSNMVLPAGSVRRFMLYHKPSETQYVLTIDGSGGMQEWTFIYRYMTHFYTDTQQQALINEMLVDQPEAKWLGQFYALGWRFLLPSEWRKH